MAANETIEYSHSQDLINRAALLILALNVYGPDEQATKGAAYALAMELQTASYLDEATKHLLGTAAACMDEELSSPADVPDFEALVYDTLYNVASVNLGYFLEPTGSPELEAKLRKRAAQRDHEPGIAP